jgi:hypothetical protein
VLSNAVPALRICATPRGTCRFNEPTRSGRQEKVREGTVKSDGIAADRLPAGAIECGTN